MRENRDLSVNQHTGTYLNTSVSLGPNDGQGSVVGLLGSDSGAANDFQLSDETVLAQPLSTAEIMGPFATARQVAPGASLLSDTDPASLAGRTTAAPIITPPPGPGFILTGSLGEPTAGATSGVTFAGSLAQLAADADANISAADMFDITNLAFGHASASLVVSGAGANLQLSDGSQSGSLQILNITSPLTAHLSSDGHGGSMVSWS